MLKIKKIKFLVYLSCYRLSVASWRSSSPQFASEHAVDDESIATYVNLIQYLAEG